MSIDITIKYSNDTESIFRVPMPGNGVVMIEKEKILDFLTEYKIVNFDIKVYTDKNPIIILKNDFGCENFNISSYRNKRASLSLLKLYNINSVHINDLDIESLNAYNSSTLLSRCNINDLYTGCEFHGIGSNNKSIFYKEYSIDIRRDSNISKLVAQGVFKLNIQESSIKECDFWNSYHTTIKNIMIWNGSNILLFKASATINKFRIENSTIETLSLGNTYISDIILNNERIGQCSVLKTSFLNSEIVNRNSFKWRLYRKSAIHNGDRKSYINACHRINKSYTLAEQNKLSKSTLRLFNVVCGYGYKPFRVLLCSSFIILFFSLIYYTISIININAFQKILSVGDIIYFSGITFTTIGFGDIQPISPMIRILSVIEGIAGVCMISLFIFSLTKTLTENT